MSYTNLLYHIVYATKERTPLITNTLRPRLHAYLGGTVRGLHGIPIEINGTADHVHLLVKLQPVLSVSEFLSKLKSNSSGWAKRQTAGRLASALWRFHRQRVTSRACAALHPQPGRASSYSYL